MSQKRKDGRATVDENVDSSVAASNIRPGLDLVKEMAADWHGMGEVRIEEMGKRNHHTGGEQRDQQNNRARYSEPPGRQTGEEQHDEFITCDRQPIDEDVHVAGRSGPFGCSKYGLEDNECDRQSKEEWHKPRRQARPENSKNNHR